MSEKVLSAGDHIASKCTKCKDTTNHTIVAMIEEKVVKVNCNTCGNTHNYRPETVKKKKASTRTSTAKPRTATKAQREWDELQELAKTATTVEYSMTASLKEGQLITHATFGLGQVISNIRPNKMEVRFQTGVKLLRCKLG